MRWWRAGLALSIAVQGACAPAPTTPGEPPATVIIDGSFADWQGLAPADYRPFLRLYIKVNYSFLAGGQ